MVPGCAVTPHVEMAVVSELVLSVSKTLQYCTPVGAVVGCTEG